MVKIITNAHGNITLEIKEREYLLITLAFRELFGSLDREEFRARMGAEFEEIVELADALAACGRSAGIQE